MSDRMKSFVRLVRSERTLSREWQLSLRWLIKVGCSWPQVFVYNVGPLSPTSDPQFDPHTDPAYARFRNGAESLIVSLRLVHRQADKVKRDLVYVYEPYTYAIGNS